MSFRRKQNAKDKWASYCQRQIVLVEATGLPAGVFRSEDSLEEFLRGGVFQAGPRTWRLTEMPDSALAALEKLIESVFDFQHSYAALTDERMRRFKRYA